MSSKLTDLMEENGIMHFTISNTDVSYVNALRRTIISDIPITAFKTAPYAENKSIIFANTSRLNNEIIKQRLSCIPICIPDIDASIKNYLLEVDVENNTDTIMYVTTKDFRIRDITTNNFLEQGVVKKIFPPYIPPSGNGEYYIDFLRLRPKISDKIPGEKIKLTCEFSVDTARVDSVYNVAGTCSYGCTPNIEAIEQQLEIRKQKWKDEGKTAPEIDFEAKNWRLLEALRYVKARSFDFVLESVGIYDNSDIIIKACDILLHKFEILNNSLEQDAVEIKASINTMENCYDITLVNEDYTVGNILNHILYTIFYSGDPKTGLANVDKLKMLDYVGFKKFHPHDTESIIRVCLTDKTKGKSLVKSILKGSIKEANEKLESIKGLFNGSRKSK
jgi:DNA-directed RNA polymerase subunit L